MNIFNLKLIQFLLSYILIYIQQIRLKTLSEKRLVKDSGKKRTKKESTLVQIVVRLFY